MPENVKERIRTHNYQFRKVPYERRSLKDMEIPIHTFSCVLFLKSLQFEKVVLRCHHE